MQPGEIWQADADGQASIPVDLNAVPLPSSLAVVMPGETWNFQAWHRDFTAAAGVTSNLTVGASVTFQ